MNSLFKVYGKKAQRAVPVSRNELVVAHLPLVKFLVDRIASSLPPNIDRDDLRSAAVFGLISAANRFDPSRGVQFKTFAERRIQGTILDEFRASNMLTRRVYDIVKTLERETFQLEQRLDRKPYAEEMAVAMKLELKDYFRLIEQVHLCSLASIDAAWEDEDGYPCTLLEVLENKGAESPQDQMITRQMWELLTESIESLPKKERIVITLHYYEDLSQKEIAAWLGLSDSRISQLHRQAIINLRLKMCRVYL